MKDALRDKVANEMWVGQKEALLKGEVTFADAVQRADRIVADVTAASAMDWLPGHSGGLYLSHNPHRDVYETVATWEAQDHRAGDWISPEERERALSTGEVWVIRWNTGTPRETFRLAASSLEALSYYLRRLRILDAN